MIDTCGGNDVLRGGQATTLDGGDGNDIVLGGTDSDLILGSSGRDVLIGKVLTKCSTGGSDLMIGGSTA
ncbi:MAG: hypothetical protein U0892_18525 [Pirellulales bacterium]